jgi:hypothetical protein
MYACMYCMRGMHVCTYVIRPNSPTHTIYYASSRCKRLHKFRPIEILLHKRTNPRVPPCEPLKKYVFKICNVKQFTKKI